MPANALLRAGTKAQINRQIDRVLADLGPVEPPLNLAVVRDRLDLDLDYFTASDVGRLDDVVHALKVGARQILRRPRILGEALRKLSLRALLLPDHRRILIDAGLPKPKQRWGEGHEIVHDVLPWHDAVAMGDRKRMLSPTCHEQIESEANYGAGRLLFLGDRFDEELRSAGTVDFNMMKRLKGVFGNSFTTTLWRVVEGAEGPSFGIISDHPLVPKNPDEQPVRYFIRNNDFAARFPGVSGESAFSLLSDYCSAAKGGPLGQREAIARDHDGQRHLFLMESFNNTYEVLTLGSYRGRLPSVVQAA